MTRLVPGQRLQNGQYTVEREVGHGRFGITYLARRADGERWVIKILDPDVFAGLSPDDLDRLETLFWQEAVKLARCRGTPHIVQAGMPFKEGTLACLPMEYVDGNSLDDRAQPILSESMALEYMRQIGEALTIVHEQKLVHRDIRPANILVRIREGKAEAVLIDFGLALAFDTELTRTRDSECIDGFSPIELYGRGRPVGAYTDVYSLAATLYQMLTGEVPVSAFDRQAHGVVLASPQQKNPNISGKTTRAILAGMELVAAKRPQSVAAWLEALGVQQTSVKTSPISGVNWSKWQTIWAAAAVVVTLVVGIPALWEWMKPDPLPQASPTNLSPAKPSP